MQNQTNLTTPLPTSPGNSEDTPVLAKSKDGIYPRCVWCNGENWAMAVIAYSKGAAACAAVNGCGRYLPDEYITLTTNDEMLSEEK